jgi:hypothetical protein
MLQPSLPLLDHVRTPEPTAWLRASLTTFGLSVASFLPGTLEAYLRLYHPWQNYDGSFDAAPTWREIAARRGVDLNDPVACESLIRSAQDGGYLRVGSLPRPAIDPLIEHLRPCTTTPERCYFAVWEGFGDSVMPRSVEPTLELPGRRYHVYTGAIEGALTSHSEISFSHRSANLWWPADHSWCVTTEVDHGWTYVGARRTCIRALLDDPRLETVETTARARW